MKKFRKIIAVILSLILTASIAMPVASAAGDELGDHTTFEDFWGQMTDEEGNINWKNLPQVLFEVFFFVRLFEVIAEWFRGIFGITTDSETPETETLEDVSIAVA